MNSPAPVKIAPSIPNKPVMMTMDIRLFAVKSISIYTPVLLGEFVIQQVDAGAVSLVTLAGVRLGTKALSPTFSLTLSVVPIQA